MEGNAGIHSEDRRAQPDRARSAIPPEHRPIRALTRSRWRNSIAMAISAARFRRREIAARAYFDLLLARTLAEGGDSYSISTAHLRYGRVYDLLTIRESWLTCGTCWATI